MDRQQSVDGFYFKQQLVSDYDVDPVAAIEADAFVIDGERDLAGKNRSCYPSVRNISIHDKPIRVAGAQLAVHCDRQTNNLLGQGIAGRESCPICALLLS